MRGFPPVPGRTIGTLESMDSLTFRTRVMEIQAELSDMDPTDPGTVERATELADELDVLAAEQRERANQLAARAFEQQVAVTGVDTPLEKVSEAVDRVTGTDATDSDEATDTTGTGGARPHGTAGHGSDPAGTDDSR